MEKQAAEGLVAEKIAALAVLVEEGLAFLIGEAAAYTVQDCYESLVIDQSFLLKIDELEGQVRANTLVLFDLGALSHSLKDSHFQLQNALIGHSALEQSKSMDKQIYVKLFPFQGNASIDVLEVLSKLLMS